MPSKMFGVVCRLSKRWLNAHFLYMFGTPTRHGGGTIGRCCYVWSFCGVCATKLGGGCVMSVVDSGGGFSLGDFPVVVFRRGEGECVLEAYAQRCMEFQRAF